MDQNTLHTLVNKLVSYTTINGDTVKGKITGLAKDKFGEFFRVKVTTGDVSAYAKGSEFVVSASNLGTFLVRR